jgi:hypothetical protein
MEKINKSEMAITIMLNVLFISLYIVIFFFTYGSFIEKKVVKNQMKFLSDNISDNIKIYGKDVNSSLKNIFTSLEEPNLVEEDKMVEESNKKVLMTAIKANVVFFIIVILIVYFIYSKSNKDFNMKRIIVQNLIILVFVGFTEFSFLTYFGSKYISIDPNFIKLKILENAHNYTN